MAKLIDDAPSLKARKTAAAAIQEKKDDGGFIFRNHRVNFPSYDLHSVQ